MFRPCWAWPGSLELCVLAPHYCLLWTLTMIKIFKIGFFTVHDHPPALDVAFLCRLVEYIRALVGIVIIETCINLTRAVTFVPAIQEDASKNLHCHVAINQLYPRRRRPKESKSHNILARVCNHSILPVWDAWLGCSNCIDPASKQRPSHCTRVLQFWHQHCKIFEDKHPNSGGHESAIVSTCNKEKVPVCIFSWYSWRST